MPLSVLSYASILGIFSLMAIIGIILFDGFTKPDSPGSLWSPADTSLGIDNFRELGIAFGLFMAGVRVFSPALACVGHGRVRAIELTLGPRWVHCIAVLGPCGDPDAGAGHGRPDPVRRDDQLGVRDRDWYLWPAGRRGVHHVWQRCQRRGSCWGCALSRVGEEGLTAGALQFSQDLMKHNTHPALNTIALWGLVITPL